MTDGPPGAVHALPHSSSTSIGDRWPGHHPHGGTTAEWHDAELFNEHLRPAWHVVLATLAALGATVLASWLGH